MEYNVDNTNINDQEQNISTNVNDKETDVTVNYKYGSKLHDAAAEGDIATISTLIEEEGFNVDLLNEQGTTPIIAAAWTNQLESLTLLLANGANINHQSQNKYSDRFSCLMIAAMYNRKDMVRLLLQHGADTSLICGEGRTAISYAAGNGCATITKVLLDHKADMNMKCRIKWSPLSYASHDGRSSCVSILLRYGCEIEDLNEFKNILQFYVPLQFEQPYIVKDCVPLIRKEFNRRIKLKEESTKRECFNDFLENFIEYDSYKAIIYEKCFPTVPLNAITPSIGWSETEALLTKYYFDEIFFLIHFNIAICYTNNKPGANTILMSESKEYLANNNNKTSLLMSILTNRLILMLMPIKLT